MSLENTALTGAQKKYLFAIYALFDKKGSVRSAEVAELVGVTRASTVKMAKRLIDCGLISKEPYSTITLTEKGMLNAKPLFDKYKKLCSVLESKGGISPERAAADAAAIITHVSEEAADGILRIAYPS